MRKDQIKFAEDITGFALFILGIILMVIFMTSCGQTRNGFDYESHAKSNAKWKHKAEHHKLPKCNRH